MKHPLKHRLVRSLMFGLASITPFLLTSCGGESGTAVGASATPNPPPVATNASSGANPVPAIDYVSPSCVPRGEQTLAGYGGHDRAELLLTGRNFLANSIVRWNGSERATAFLSNTQLTAQILPSDIASVGTVVVTVFNPAPGGGTSGAWIFTITAGGVGPQSVAVDPAGKFAYVADEGCGDGTFGYVSLYTIDANSGALASIGPPALSGDEGAKFVAVSPDGRFVYLANWGEGDTGGSLSAFTINATTGALTSLAWAPCVSPANPCLAPASVAVHPSGKFAYAANEGGFAPTGVSVYTIDAATGALTFKSSISAPGTGRAVTVAVDPSGRFAYVAALNDAAGSDDNVSTYKIDPTTGSLTYVSTVAAGSGPPSIAIDPSVKFLYVTNSGSNDVSMYTINSSTGALTSLGTMSAGSGPSAIAIHPSGKFAYVTNSGSNDVSMYTINSSTGVNSRTGALTFLGTMSAGSGPSAIAIHPSGEFAYVTNSGSNDVWTYSIDGATGALMLMGTAGT